ncbi:Nicastrin [Zea mays]|uniref:Nicastrin n=1 Tax=Zea mays TaxID=4577 RepID=A0A3L6D6E0_MAIZE|nr:Nicastrin [Zea mays]
MSDGSTASLVAAVICLALAVFAPAVPGNGATLESVPDLVKAMYLNVESFPYPGSEKVIAPIVRLRKGSDQLVQPSTILLSLDQMSDFFLSLPFCLGYPMIQNFTRRWLVYWLSQMVNNDLQGHYSEPTSLFSCVICIFFCMMVPKDVLHFFMYIELSPDRKFPQDDFAPYSNHSHDWNPAGSGIMWNKYNFPVFLLSEESTNTLQKISEKNEKTGNGYKANVAEFDLVMQTTKAQTHDSASCLKEQSCLPLGGHSVWTSLPPLKNGSTEHPKPLILAIASQDSASFFRDRSLGSDSPISGLIALLTAVDALSHIHGLSKLKKQLVFAVFNGEAWGYLGSRKFLQELDEGAASVNGINSLMIDQVLEIGSVGKAILENIHHL